MPAVLVTLSDIQRVVDHIPYLVAGVVAALESWAQPQPFGKESQPAGKPSQPVGEPSQPVGEPPVDEASPSASAM
jgi:hypothetical protein